MIDIFQEDVVYHYIGLEISHPSMEVLQGLSLLVFALEGIVELIAHQCGCCVNRPGIAKIFAV